MDSAGTGATSRQVSATRPRRAVVVAVLVGLTTLLAATAVLTTGLRTASGPSLRVGVVPDYVSFPPDGRTVFALDPATLADAGPGVEFDGGPYGRAVAGDGTTWVSLERTLTANHDIVRDSVTVVVRDSPTGAERVRFTPRTLVCCPLLNRDGTRLVIMGLQHDGRRGLAERFTVETSDDRPPTSWTLYDLNTQRVAMRLTAWFVHDTVSGRLLTTATAPAPEGEVWWSWLDPTGRRLHHLIVPGQGSDAAPRPLRLVAYDLTTGVEVGRLELSDVLAGWWTTPQTGDRSEIEHLTRPGVALAPDGRRLALAHVDSDAVTLVDTERLAVERTVALIRLATPLDWLGLESRSAAAKGLVEETVRQATFALDGRHLYLYGWAMEGVAGRGFGLRRVDLDTGRVVAVGLGDEAIPQIVPAPDGRSLYALGTEQPQPRRERPPHRLRRLDAATLTVLAERAFDGPRRLLAWPDGHLTR